jgi:hypothetical protein
MTAPESELSDHIALIQDEIAWRQREIDKYPTGHPDRKPRAITQHRAKIEKHEKLLLFLENLVIPRSHLPLKAVAISKANELASLPDHVIRQLKVKSEKGSDDPVLTILKTRGGYVSADDILIDLHKIHKEDTTRQILLARLYRLSQKGYIVIPPGRKGIYTLPSR